MKSFAKLMGKNTNVCILCHGSGNLTCQNFSGRLEFWPCSACDGTGARITKGPAEFKGPRLKIRKKKDPVK